MGRPVTTAAPAVGTGIYRGTVVNATDPMGKGRVKVSIPSLGGSDTYWAWRCRSCNHPSALLVGSIVFVGFVEGDINEPVVLGSSG
jgi:hypothetical protein